MNILIFPKRVSMNDFVLCSEKIWFCHVLATNEKSSTRIFEAEEVAGVVVVGIVLADGDVVSAFWDCVDTLHRN